MYGDARVVAPGATTGQDVFVFAPGNGQDLIGDFEHGKDVIDLTAFAAAGIHGFGDLHIESPSQLPFASDATGSTIRFDSTNLIFVANDLSLTTQDFLFG